MKKMETKLTVKLVIMACAIFATVLMALNSDRSLAWFYATVDPAPDAPATAVSMGILDVDLQYNPEIQEDTGSFTLKNTGTLGAYVRMWQTFQCYNNNGELVLGNTADIDFVDFSLMRGNQAQPYTFKTLTHTAGGFAQEKEFLIPLDDQGKYCYLEPGQVLEAEYRLSGVPTEGKLHVSWVAEAIQGSSAALEDAADYGWDAALAKD